MPNECIICLEECGFKLECCSAWAHPECLARWRRDCPQCRATPYMQLELAKHPETERANVRAKMLKNDLAAAAQTDNALLVVLLGLVLMPPPTRIGDDHI